MTYNPIESDNYDLIEQQPTFSSNASAPVLIQTQNMLLGPGSTCTTCVYCNVVVNTQVKLTNNALTHIAGALWCAKCCMCCCIPYSTDSAKNVDHYCPLCFRYLGTYRR